MRADWRTLTLLFVSAFAVRLAARAYFGFDAAPATDEIELIEPSAAVADGRGISRVPQQSVSGESRPSAFRMPLPILALGAAFAVTGEHVRTSYWMMIGVTSLSAPLAFGYARSAGAGRPAALLAGAAVCVYPTWVYYSVQVLSDGFFVSALLGALWVLVWAAARPTTSRAAAAGLAWGLATLVRPHALPIAVLLSAYHVWRGDRRLAAGIALGVGLCLLPWASRNYLVFGRFIPLATESGETFLGSNNPYVVADPVKHGMWVSPLSIDEYRDRLAPVQDDTERSRLQTALGVDYLRSNPGVVPRLAWYKLARWLTPVTASGGVIRAAVLVSYGGLLLALGTAVARRRRVPTVLRAYVVGGTLTLAIITVVYWGCLTRGRLPLEIFWLPIAAHTLVAGRSGAAVPEGVPA